MPDEQTIVAIATPPGKGGLAVVRLSGETAYQVAARVFRPKNRRKNINKCPGYTALYGAFLRKGAVIDDGVALLFRRPHSYTGEDVVELSCHGGDFVSRELLAACVEAGARPAEAGEYTRRAFLNGKMSISQAEAVMDLITAESRQALDAAHSALAGALNDKINGIKTDLIALAGHLAAVVDYPEEDVEELTSQRFLETIQNACAELDTLIEDFERGSLVRRGVRAAIVGSPNVGKSTLFNLMAGFERTIVTPVAGTTRDVVSEQVQVGGVALLLADTAGLRDTSDAIEEEGIRRSYAEIQQADLVLAVFDGSIPLTEADLEISKSCAGKKSIAIVNKSDKGIVIKLDLIRQYFTSLVVVSAHESLSRNLIDKAVENILMTKPVNTDVAVLANQRQLKAATDARHHLMESKAAILTGLALDAAGVCLDDALQSLSELSGDNVSDSVVEEVFSKFCVGK